VKQDRSAGLGALALFAGLAAIVLAVALRLTGGHLGFALDDAYVHLAMAKQLARHGVWGVTPYGFSSSSSSPLWTLLLALGFLLTGPNEVLPFVLNVLAALGALWAARALLRRCAPGIGPRAEFLALAGLVVFTPLVPLVFMGQEHTLQLLLTLLFAERAARRLAGSGGARALLLLAPALTAVRYEGLFLVLTAAALLALRRRGREALALGAAGLLPAIVYGVVSLSHGAYFVPNPILIKANLPGGDAAKTIETLLGYTALRRLFANVHLLVPVLGALLLLARRGGAGAWRAPLTLFVIGTALHLTAADVGWFYRYEAYLVGLGVLALAGAWAAQPGLWAEWTRARVRGTARLLAALALALVCAGALADRGVRALVETPRAIANIHEQQYQMGRFLSEAYPGAAVAVNDIGAVDYLADVKLLDLMGLASVDVAAHIRAGTYNPRALDSLVRDHGVRVAVIYRDWLRVPSQWRWVGDWTIRHNVVTGGATVSFYAVDPAEEEPLAEKLRRFGPRLPATVEQSGPYTGER
jgi:hypothetical protein